MAPAPFNTVYVVASNLLGLSINASINTSESCRLAERVARLSFAVLQLSIRPGNFQGASVVSIQLTKVFTSAVQLLQRFQPASKAKRNVIDILQSNVTLYSASSVEQFNGIHQQLTVIMQDRAFMLSVSDEALLHPPSLTDIQESIHSDVNHVIAEVRKRSLENGSRFDHIDAQLQTVLSTLRTGREGRRDVAILDPCSLQIDTTCVLGKGASGTVYAGKLYGTTEVAVKILSRSDGAAVEALRRELERTVRVAHRNVIKVYGMVQHCSVSLSGQPDINPPAVVSERLGTTTLEPVLGKLSPSQAMKLTLDIIMGMAKVLDLEDGVVHFDLKPQNVLLSLDGRTAVISDFGIAQSKTTVAYASPAENALVRGTVAYMAPEILLGTARRFACDVYSFAVLLYALWTGRVPWQGFADSTSITAVQQGSRPAVDLEMIAWGVPEPIVALIVACWDASPGNRPSFKTILQLREIDMFWESPTTRWPAYLVAVMHSGSPLRMDDIFSFTASPSTTNMTSRFSKGSISGSRRVGTLVSATAVGSLSADQLCEYLRESCSIDDSVVGWLREKKINGDVFLASGRKIIDRLRLVDIDEWHVDALERCHTKLSAAADAEQTRQQQLLEARQTMANTAKAVAQAEAEKQQLLEEARLLEAKSKSLEAATQADDKKQGEAAALKAKQANQAAQTQAAAAVAAKAESKRVLAATRAKEYERYRQLNLACVEKWQRLYAVKSVPLVDDYYRDHVSPKYTSVSLFSGKQTNCTYVSAKARTLEHMRTDARLISYFIVDATDTFVRFKYTLRWPSGYTFDCQCRFDFETPGVTLRGDYSAA